MRMPRWALVAAALLALFQAWLWLNGSYYLLATVCISIGAALLLSAIRPSSALSEKLARTWGPRRRPHESARHFHLRIAGLWVFVAVTASTIGYFIPPSAPNPEGEFREMIIFFGVAGVGFLSTVMALQAALNALLNRPEVSDT